MTATIVYTGAVMTADTEDVAPREKSVAAVQSVDRALLVLEILGKLGNAGVTEIAAELGVHKSTVSRLITVPGVTRFRVEQLSDRGKYRLGFALVRLAGSTSAQMDLAKQSQATWRPARRTVRRDRQCGDPRRRQGSSTSSRRWARRKSRCAPGSGRTAPLMRPPAAKRCSRR